MIFYKVYWCKHVIHVYISECEGFHKHCTFILNRDYRAEYEKLKAEKEQKERSRQKDQMSRLQNDVNLGGQGDMEGTLKKLVQQIS